MKAFEQVVGEQGVLGDAADEGGGERIDVEEALAREDALAEEVLVGVGDRRWCRGRRPCGRRRVRAKSEPAALSKVTLTRGCRIP